MNILIKLTCLVGLVIAPILGGHTNKDKETQTSLQNKSISVETEQIVQVENENTYIVK